MNRIGGAMQDEDLTGTIIGCAFKVHKTLKAGFSEQVYENALRIELGKQGLRVRQQAPIRVTYSGISLPGPVPSSEPAWRSVYCWRP